LQLAIEQATLDANAATAAAAVAAVAEETAPITSAHFNVFKQEQHVLRKQEQDELRAESAGWRIDHANCG
jgi:hypothetical protein